jgi:hypothetical protein
MFLSFKGNNEILLTLIEKLIDNKELCALKSYLGEISSGVKRNKLFG